MTDPPPLDGADFEYLYELYHKNLPPLVSEATLTPDSNPERSSGTKYKTYRRAETVPLATPESSALLSSLGQRASYATGTERRSITETELATLLAYSYGEIRESDGEPRRPVASGGACYPLELYPIILDSPDIEAGIYHYNVRDDALEQLTAGDNSEWLRDHWTWITDDEQVAAAIVITAFPARSADRYGEMSYLFAAIEAGAVIQNLQLVATDLGIGSRPHNGLNYSAIREQLRLRSDEYLLSTVVFAGTHPSDSE
ncbi:SagB/ThcOx family dehydrogenase [Halonotius terrestris]|uniref:SagB/ThcOx family dehydrogenase n=1 Tax=Halonotius terrestris TaxID=2487750 RepID=A0A8J8P8U0_9EURY|nr:SagB/ThcOx family dehydrogenase [Halonotius terrestris]TQQ83045.1 SagB/ThcOx family dehydrogenase [Halonotius terrestris]